MQEIPREQVMKRFQFLPVTLQDAIFSQASADAVLKICALRDVPDEEAFLVGQLTSRVLLGFLRPENFASEVQKETGVDGVKAVEVAHDIDGEIFSSVRLELKKLYPPTIQTPTVQSQGFAYQAPQPPAAAVRHAPEPARPYVVPIPEKFRTKSAWPQGQELGNREQGEGIRNGESGIKSGEENQKEEPTKPSVIHDSKFIIQEKPAAPAPQTPAQQEPKPTSTPLSDIKPIVPLPTFIQSKFKETLKQTTGEKQTTQENPALKSAFTHFTAPHTAARPAGEQPKESVYREPITESQKPQGGQPASEGQQRAEGKVVDLSGL